MKQVVVFLHFEIIFMQRFFRYINKSLLIILSFLGMSKPNTL
jgi:hypothetical protein